MALDERIDAAVAEALARATGGAAPPRLAAALPYAVLPGGARIRPTLLLSVAMTGQSCRTPPPQRWN
jgi:geranylgeranyl diphosphate synthase type II